MAYNVVYKSSCERDLNKLDKREARRILNKIEKELSEKADRYPSLKGEFSGLRKLRIGNYRVIFVILNNDVIILRVAHRKDIYKKEL